MRKLFREHWHVFLVIPALIIVMTWPTFHYALDATTFWIPSRGQDVWYELWEGWYGRQIISGKADLFYTNLLFYPQGASLIYHQHTVPHMLLYAILRAVLPVSNAYNSAFLLTLFANALATYLCANHFIKDKWISLFAAALVGICVTLRTKTDAQFWTFYTLPLAIYFLRRAIDDRSWKLALLAGVAVGGTLYIGFYVLVCLALTIAIYGAYLALSRWRDRRFWLLVSLAGGFCLLISLPRLVPMALDREQADTVLEYRSYWDSASNDLLDFFLHPALTDASLQPAYLGAVPLLLLCVGFANRANWRNSLHWLLILIVFVVLRLGTFLTINGVEYPDILLPKHYLNYLAPALFRGFAGGHHWVLGALVPLAILSCYGLSTLLRARSQPIRITVALAAIALMSIEHYQLPIFSRVVDPASVAFNDWLKTEDDEAIRLINLPMNTTFLRRNYNFLQMLNGYPQVEGAVNRVLPEAYAFIQGNMLLRAWKNAEAVHCLPWNAEPFNAALDQLVEVGFTHIVLHKPDFMRTEYHSFASVPKAYQDEYAAIMRLRDLRRSCENSAILAIEALPHLPGLALAPDIRPNPDALVLSVHADKEMDADALAYVSSIYDGWAGFVHLYEHESQAALQSANERFADMDDLASRHQLVLRLRAPRNADAASESLEDALAQAYRRCPHPEPSLEGVAEFLVRADFPCQLVAAGPGAAVDYDNSLALANIQVERRDDRLDFRFHWKRRPGPGARSAFSLQVFDADGVMAWQTDSLIRDDPLEYRQLDLSELPRGDYVALLIVYDHASGASVSGYDRRRQSAFNRELELLRFTIE